MAFASLQLGLYPRFPASNLPAFHHSKKSQSVVSNSCSDSAKRPTDPRSRSIFMKPTNQTPFSRRVPFLSNGRLKLEVRAAGEGAESLDSGSVYREEFNWSSVILPFIFPALGGLLFGYDIGATSGATLSLQVTILFIRQLYYRGIQNSLTSVPFVTSFFSHQSLVAQLGSTFLLSSLVLWLVGPCMEHCLAPSLFTH
nr:D-xylose-proton symporter-like 3, chloroplastic [Ipomoea batatas]